MITLTTTQLKERFTALIMGAGEWPKKELDRHVLLVSATLRLEPQRKYSEKDLNEALQWWSTRFGRNFKIDHVTLRRYLVDEGYLHRDSAGGQYELATENPPYAPESRAEPVDLEALIEDAKKARELRKMQFMNKNRNPNT